MRLSIVGVFLLAIPGVARADMMAFPGYSPVPRDFIFEVETDFPSCRFWLVSPRGVEPLNLAPSHPVRVDGDGRTGSHRIAYVVAAPVEVVEKMGEARFVETIQPGKYPPGVAYKQIDFYGAVPFWDSRERVIDRYRVELVPGQELQLVRLEQNAGSRTIKVAWAAGGVFVVVATIGTGWWLARRLWRVAARKNPGA